MSWSWYELVGLDAQLMCSFCWRWSHENTDKWDNGGPAVTPAPHTKLPAILLSEQVGFLSAGWTTTAVGEGTPVEVCHKSNNWLYDKTNNPLIWTSDEMHWL